METRKQALEELKSFISESEGRINSILDSIGWSTESVQHSHIIKQRDDVEDVKGPANSTATFPASFQSKDSSASIRLDNIKQAEAILEDVYQNPSFDLGVPLEELVNRKPPSNLEDLHVNFTRDERLSMYQHVLKHTAKPPDVPEIKIRYTRDAHSEEKVASLTEIAAIDRDARRRNPKHRVSKNPLTYREEVRHLIQVQTDALAHHFRQSSSHSRQASDKSKKKKSKHVRKSRSTSTEPERRHKKRKRHSSRERSQSAEAKRHKSHKKHKKRHKQ